MQACTEAPSLALLARIRTYLRDMNRAHARRISAQRLAELADHELRDIGLSRADAKMLARNPDVLPSRLRRY
jgi:uncharacterized protein YjiS (DUF1127 family)